MLNIDIDSGLRNNAATMIRGKLRIKISVQGLCGMKL